MPTFSKVVIDGDQLVYAAGFACKDEPISHACQTVKKSLEKILNDCAVEDYELYISGKGNFREDIAVTKGYKANRVAAKPEHYGEIRDYMQGVWGAEKVDDMEVDDKVSILLYEDFLKGEGMIVLSSPDKDLNNTPGWHYNPRTRDIKFITEEQATRHFWFQMLVGDTVDNITGLPRGTRELMSRYGLTHHCLKGMGEANAKRIMAFSKGDLMAEIDVLTSYCYWAKDEGMDIDTLEEYINEQGQLLWMVREVDEFGPVMWNVDRDSLEIMFKEVQETLDV